MGKYNILNNNNNNNEGSNYHQVLHQHSHLLNHQPSLNAHTILAMAAQSPNNLNLTPAQIQCLQQQQQQQQSNKTPFYTQQKPNHLQNLQIGNQSQQQQIIHPQLNGIAFKNQNPISYATASHINNHANKVNNSKLSPIGSIASCATSPSSQTSTNSANFSSISPSPTSPNTESHNSAANPPEITDDLLKRDRDCDQDQGIESTSSEMTTGTSDQSNEPLNSSVTEANEDPNNEFNKVYLVYTEFYLDEECNLIQNLVIKSSLPLNYNFQFKVDLSASHMSVVIKQFFLFIVQLFIFMLLYFLLLIHGSKSN